MKKLYPVAGWRDNVIELEGYGPIEAYVEDLRVGVGSLLSPDLEIGMPGKPVEAFHVGTGARIYGGQIASKTFYAGDYLTIHEGVWAYGHNDIVIGHNCWFGRRCTLDAEGMFWVGNGLGAGQDSHLWSHIRHGDTLAGNRWLKYGELIIGDDVWLVGRTTTGPYRHEQRSMAMVESNLTKGMPHDTVWGGNPAKDLTERLGPPFERRPDQDRRDDFLARCQRFINETGTKAPLVWAIAARFDPVARTYEKDSSPLEQQFMRFLLPEAKFTPRQDPNT